jgi:hypothetical protein
MLRRRPAYNYTAYTKISIRAFALPGFINRWGTKKNVLFILVVLVLTGK